MCRELIGNILKIMQSGTSFTRKKAPLAAAKIMKKLPDHLTDIIEKINTLMEDRHHGNYINLITFKKVLTLAMIFI